MGNVVLTKADILCGLRLLDQKARQDDIIIDMSIYGGDFSDIEFLAEEAGIRDTKSALELIEAFYPASRIPAKVAFGVEEIMERIAQRKAHP
jgi:hypothetical protein